MSGSLLEFSDTVLMNASNIGGGIYENGRIHTIFCSQLKNASIFWTIARHVIIVTLIFLILYAIFNLYQTRDEHPIKQRAPLVAMFHLFLMFLYLTLLYILEWNSLKSWKVKSYYDISLMRRIIQKIVVFFRTSFASVYILRTVVIWCQWKCHRRSIRLTIWFANEKKAIFTYACLFVLGVVASILIGQDGSGMFYPSLNWFCPGRKRNYILVNLGFFSMTEIALLCTCFYLLRNFPSNFGVKKEALWMCATCFVCTLLTNILNPFNLGDSSHRCEDTFPPYFIPQFSFEYIRTLSLTLSIWYLNQPKPLVPPTPTRILTNFKVFTSNPLCVKAFAAYLPSLRCNRVTEEFEDYMREQLKETDALITRGSSESGLPTALHNAFREYQKTKSFEFIKNCIEEYETVFHLRFKMVVY